MCRTPNYILSKVLDKKGHSYEVYVWSIGCILYTLGDTDPQGHLH